MTEHPSLFDWKPKFGSDFDGTTFEPRRDGQRLNRQLSAVYSLMCDGQWRTLAEISEATGAPEASCSARLRDCRKSKFLRGAIVERQFMSKGLWKYRLVTHDNS